MLLSAPAPRKSAAKKKNLVRKPVALRAESTEMRPSHTRARAQQSVAAALSLLCSTCNSGMLRTSATSDVAYANVC
jgi:hypothetical protein